MYKYDSLAGADTTLKSLKDNVTLRSLNPLSPAVRFPHLSDLHLSTLLSMASVFHPDPLVELYRVEPPQR